MPSEDELVRGLLALGESIASLRPLGERLANVCRTTASLLGCDRSSIFLARDGYYRAGWNFGNPPDIAAHFPRHRVRLDDPLIEQAMKSRRPVVVNDAPDSPLIRTTAEQARIRAIVVAPMYRNEDEPLGFLTAEYNENPGHFSDSTSTLVLGVARLVQSAIFSEEVTTAYREMAAEKARLEARKDYQALLDSVNGIVWEGDPRTLRFHFVSEEAERLLGYPAKQWIEEPRFWVEHIHPDDRERVVASCAQENAKGLDHELEYRMLSADGRVVWLRDIVSVTVEDGQAVRCRGVMVDVGERKAAEDALRRVNDRLHAVMANAPVVLFTLNREGVCTFCEGRIMERAGVSPSDIVGRSVDDLFAGRPEGAPIRANLRRALAGEEFAVQERLGDVISETRLTTLRDADGNPDGVVGVVLDVADRIRAEEESHAIQKQMLHAQKLESLGVLAGGIAHDFNNLLMTIQGSADLVISDLPEDSDLRRGVGRIRRSARTAANLTNQLLAYAGERPLQIRPLDLSAAVLEMADLLPLSVSKKAHLNLDLVDDLPAIEADSAQLTQIILNLVTNASEALSEESGTIKVRTGTHQLGSQDLSRAYLREGLIEGRYVFLEVSDTGQGMDEETRSRMFDPFFTTKFTGRGLGLAGVLGIVRAHRGTLGVYSEPGQGTLVRVLFPSTEAAVATTTPPSDHISWRGEGVLLVVDDEPDVRELAGEMVERLGFRVLCASDGAEAVRVFSDHADEIRGVLLDMTMPEMDGRETARELRQVRPEIPIVFMSGYDREYAATRLESDVTECFVQKPFEQVELVQVLRRALGECD